MKAESYGTILDTFTFNLKYWVKHCQMFSIGKIKKKNGFIICPKTSQNPCDKSNPCQSLTITWESTWWCHFPVEKFVEVNLLKTIFCELLN